MADLKKEQQHLVKLSFRGQVHDDVLTSEQERIAKAQREIEKRQEIARHNQDDITARSTKPLSY